MNSNSNSLIQSDGNNEERPKNTRNISVLNNDKYQKEIERIIERDFFGHMELDRLMVEYEEARQNGELQKAADIQQLISKEEKKKCRQETASCTSDARRESDSNVVNSSLNEFMNNHMSKDDYNVYKSLKRQTERKEKLNQIVPSKHRKKMKCSFSNVPSFQEQLKGNRVGEKVVMENWKHQDWNSLMYSPNADHSNEHVEKSDGVQICHENTRLDNQMLNGDESALGKRLKEEKEMFRGRDNIELLKHPKLDVNGQEILPKNKPKIMGYDFAKTPTPMPGIMAGDDSPMMTWGDIDGTPIAANDPSATNGPMFQLMNKNPRETLGLKLVDDIAKKKEKQQSSKFRQHIINKRMMGQSPLTNVTSQIKRIDNMSPVAKNLFQKTNKLRR
ncbi:hypothetical protein SNEBB_008552 [Seison nebaliae]|nr:hypothetical protein SNEBB_008552 [Seison nebaliae]